MQPSFPQSIGDVLARMVFRNKRRLEAFGIQTEIGINTVDCEANIWLRSRVIQNTRQNKSVLAKQNMAK